MSQPRTLSLVCLPHAGGGTARYLRWRRDLPAGVRLVVPSLPGRQARLLEDPHPDVASAADAVLAQVPAPQDGGVALVGISYGALIAFDVAARLEASGRRVEALFVASQRAPSRRPPQVGWDQLGDERVLEEMRSIGGLTPEMDDPEFRELFLPVIRAELHASESYLRPQAYQDLRCPVFVYHGTGDGTVPEVAARAWCDDVEQVSWRSFDAGHFLTGPQEQDLWFDALRADVVQVRDGRSTAPVGPRQAAR